MRPWIRVCLSPALLLMFLAGCNFNPAPETPASAATETPAPASPTLEASATAQPSPTRETPLATATSSGPTPTAPLSQSDALEFVSDVSVPDGTVYTPGATFTKTWRLRNSGQNSWTTGYALRFVDGDAMGASPEQALDQNVPPGSTVDISVDLVAPQESGEYRGNFMLRNAAGEVFGLGTNADQAFYVIIEVRAPGAGPIPTESSGGPGMISAASLTVDQSNYSGACPVTLAFSGSITSQGTGSFEYRMEAGSSTSGFSFFLPPKLKATYDSGGSHSLNIAYTLEIESSVQGWARVTVDPPHSFSSSQVNFSVTCQ